MTLVAAVAEIQARVDEITSIRKVGDPDGRTMSGISAEVWPGPGVMDMGPVGVMHGTHNITIYVKKPAKDLARDIADLTPFIDRVPNQLWSDLMDSNFAEIDHFDTINYDWVHRSEGGVITVRGVQFVMKDVVLRDILSA